MAELVEFELADGSTLLVEVNEPKTSGPRPVAKRGELAAKAQKTFEQALDNLQPMVTAIKNKLDGLNQPADEVEVKFGVKLSGQVGAVLTAGAEATYEITLKWDNRK
ncbi:MAG: CU044_2847 family protein [Cyanobacteria bacterium P01_G01_bin.54]